MDATPEPAHAIEFDLASENIELDKAKRRKLAWLVGGLVFAIVFALVFVVTDIKELETEAISGVRLVALIIVVVFAGLMVQTFFSGIRGTRVGGVTVR